MGERRSPHIGRRAMRHTVENVVQHPRGPGKACQRLFAHAGFIAAGIGFFQQKRRDDRRQVRIATTFAQAVQRTLDLPRARINSRQRTGHCIARVVMGVNAKVIARNATCDDGCRDLCLLYTSPSPRDLSTSRMPSSA